MAPSLNWDQVYVWRSSLQVPSPHCWSFQLISSPLRPGSLSHPWCLRFSSGSPLPNTHTHTHTHTTTLLHISIHSPGPLGFSPLSPIPVPDPLSPLCFSPNLLCLCITLVMFLQCSRVKDELAGRGGKNTHNFGVRI